MFSGLYGQQYYIDKEAEYGAHNYRPIPVVISRGKGKRGILNLKIRISIN